MARTKDAGRSPALLREGGKTAATTPQPNKMANFRRRAGCCIRVAPWVSAISCIMVAVGLAVWYIYTERALNDTQSLATQLFDQPLYLVQQLTIVIGWARLLMVIAVSCLLGITVFLGLLRSYQHSARLPSTTCGAPSKVSYCSYASLIAMLNFAWWLLTVVVVLMIAANLVWLTVAFIFERSLYMGVMSVPETAGPNAAYVSAARGVIQGMPVYSAQIAPMVAKDATLSALPDVQQFNKDVEAFVSATTVPVTVCPASCLNMGSFYDTLRLSSSCICSKADAADLRSTSTNLWKLLVHVLAALALMCLGCLWQIMNMSANFAHARRDVRDLAKPHTIIMAGDAIAGVHITPFGPNSRKSNPKASSRQQDQDIQHTIVDTAAINPTLTSPAAAAPEADPALDGSAADYSNGYDSYDEKPAVSAEQAAAVAQAQRRASSPSPRSSEAEQASSAAAGSRGATFNSTAQRYAAYRLRAAQAAAAKSPTASERKQWVR